MSEYQYYEFQAIDKPLDENALEVMRGLSTRAHVTATSFSNEYNYGNFKGDPLKLIELFYDAFVYVSNWGTRELMIKIPRKSIDWGLINLYCIGESATAHPKGDFLIFEFSSDTEDYEWEQGEGWLSSLISLRSDIMQGDYRCLYLGWLYSAQNRDFDDDDPEPPVPEGLKNLNGALKSFIEFVRIDTDLVAVAAENSSSNRQSINKNDLGSWVDSLPIREKDRIIKELLLASNPHQGSSLLQQFKKEYYPESKQLNNGNRTVGDLLLKVDSYAEKRKRELAVKKAKEQAAKEKAAAISREKYLNEMAGREDDIWDQVEGLINGKKSKLYKEALRLLIDLQDLGKKNKSSHIFQSRVHEIRQSHQRKTTFIKELNRAGLK